MFLSLISEISSICVDSIQTNIVFEFKMFKNKAANSLPSKHKYFCHNCEYLLLLLIPGSGFELVRLKYSQLFCKSNLMIVPLLDAKDHEGATQWLIIKGQRT